MRQWLRTLLTLNGSPRGVAGGFALGLSLSLVPIPFAGMFLALATAPLLRCNLPATYAGTDTVVATMSYGPCLTAFYDDNPQMRQYGNFGQQIFGDGSAGGEGWKARLCGDDIDHSPCEIVWITQRFDTVQQLAVTYQVSEAMHDGTLLFGPIPTAATAQCDGDALPIQHRGDGRVGDALRDALDPRMQ